MRRVELAERKFGLIAPAVNGTFPDASMAAYFRRVAERPLAMPDGTTVALNASTLASWRRRYIRDGFEGLVPKGRSDLGKSRRIDADLGADIQAMRAEHPAMSAKMAHERLVEEGHVAAGELSVATVRRWFKNNPMPEGPQAPQKDRRAFEAARVNGIWQADTLYGPHVTMPDGRLGRAYLQAIIDDKSRKLVAARFVGRDDAASFQGTLRGAVASHGVPEKLLVDNGVPEKLLVDNGAPYKNAQLSLICGGLGIALAHAAVRDGAAKGKILYAA